LRFGALIAALFLTEPVSIPRFFASTPVSPQLASPFDLPRHPPRPAAFRCRPPLFAKPLSLLAKPAIMPCFLEHSQARALAPAPKAAFLAPVGGAWRPRQKNPRLLLA